MATSIGEALDACCNTGTSPRSTSPSGNTEQAAAPRKGRRQSLSTWYSDAGVDCESDCDGHLSPKRQAEPGVNSCSSPSKKGRLRVNYFIGQDNEDDDDVCGAADGSSQEALPAVHKKSLGCTDAATILRSVCSDYFESNVAPMISHLQESHRQFDEQLCRLQSELGKKAGVNETCALPSEVEQEVATRARKDIAAPDQFKALSEELLELRAEVFEQQLRTCSTTTTLDEKIIKIGHEVSEFRGELQAATSKLDKLLMAMESKANISDVATVSQAADSLRAELQEFQADTAKKMQFESELRAMTNKLENEVVRVDHQLRQLRQDLCVVGGRWQGRVLSSSYLGSEVGSDVASLNGSTIAESVFSVTSSKASKAGQANDEKRHAPQEIGRVGGQSSGRARLQARLAARCRQKDRNAYKEANATIKEGEATDQ